MPDVLPVLPESNLSKAIRLLSTVIGTNNPTAQALAALTPVTTGEGGGVIGAAQRTLLLQQLGITS